MAIKSLDLKRIIENLDVYANFSLRRSKADKDYYFVRFEFYDAGLWRLYLTGYSKKYLFQVWKETTDKDINEYIR